MNTQNKKGCIAVFTKTPGLTPVKTRLAKTIGTQKAEEIFVQCLKTLHHTLKKFKTQNPEWDIQWTVAEENGVNHNFWKDKSFARLWTGDGELGTRLSTIYQTLTPTYDNIIFIGADCPHISPDELTNAATTLQQHATIAGPTHDGGYYLFGAHKTPISSEIWESVPYSQSNTLEEFLKKLDLNTPLLSLKTDLDEIEDITPLLHEINLMGEEDFTNIKNALEKLL